MVHGLTQVVWIICDLNIKKLSNPYFRITDMFIHNSVQGDDKTTDTRVLGFFLCLHCVYLYFRCLYCGHIYLIHSDCKETTNYLCRKLVYVLIQTDHDYLNEDWYKLYIFKHLCNNLRWYFFSVMCAHINFTLSLSVYFNHIYINYKYLLIEFSSENKKLSL